MILIRRNSVALYLHLFRRFISSTTRTVHKPDLPAKAYKPEIVETSKYKKWESEGRFKASMSTSMPTFSMVLPPPNVTGKLHLGHALACTIQDVIVRRKRSMGFNVLWLPGTDHAGIATQGVVEKYLKSKQNICRHQLGREKFISEVLKWKEKHGDTICEQLRTLGCSLDWSRQTFTMDPMHTHSVNTAFIRLFQKGRIYRKKALVNWCNALKSTVSDIEVENLTLTGPNDIKIPGYAKPVKFGVLYDFAYPVIAEDKEIVVSTTMPETMLGDTGIAVHPHDERYQHLIGKHVMHPFRKDPIPIIADEFVDMKFGSGAVKLTPAHSKIDNMIAKKHKLPPYEILTEDGRMQNSGKFDNLKRYDCRELLVDKLEELGLLRKISPHQMTLPVCSRSGDVIDHILKEQWFLKCSKMNERAAKLARTGELKIEPDKFINYWLNWTEDDRDWCISRQLWWGHQIPAYKCQVDDNVAWIAATDPKSAKEQASKILRAMPDDITAARDSDVLDTWFSSGIYPFASLGWPSSIPDKLRHNDYNIFYPLSLMATGHDILGFWVHRMVILGLELTGKLPFDHVLLHGIICDSKGAKMSKSRGNVIDPIDVINGISMENLKKKSVQMKDAGLLNDEELQKALAYHKSNFSNTQGIPQCGVDALRFTLLSQDIKSHFIHFDIAMCNANKLFCNKIWQSIKYMQIQYVKLKSIDREIIEDDLTNFDKWILSRLADMIKRVNTAMDSYNFHTAVIALRTFIHNEFCDMYLEATKVGFENEDASIGYAHAHTLSVILNTSLRCLAPIMVYLSDELIPKIPAFEKNIIHNFDDSAKSCYEFPQYKDFEKWKNEEAEKRVEKILNSINLVRALRGLYSISNQVRPTVSIISKDSALLKDMTESKNVFMHLTRTNDVKFDLHADRMYATGFLDRNTEIFVEIIAANAENVILSARDKIQRKIHKLEDALAKMEAKIASKTYIDTSPEWMQKVDKEKLFVKKRELHQLQKLVPHKV